jgi:hypothetical protein
MKHFTALLGLGLLAGCSAPPAGYPELDTHAITFNNFEAGGGWSNDPIRNNQSLVARGNAHSGQYALRVDRDHEFSLTYDMPMGLLSHTRIKIVHLEAWVFMVNYKATANIGLQIMEPDGQHQVYADDLKLREVVNTFSKWVMVSKDFPLPDSLKPEQHLRVYLWRADAREEVLLDDVKLSITTN